MTAIELPETCIPDLSVSFDHSGLTDWPCKRAQAVSMLHVFKENIESAERQLARARSPRVSRNLTNYIADAEKRLTVSISRLDRCTCTCRESGLYG